MAWGDKQYSDTEGNSMNVNDLRNVGTSNPLSESMGGFLDAPLDNTPYRPYMETTPQYIAGQGIARYMPSLRSLIPIRKSENIKGTINVDEVGLFSFIFYSWLSPFIYKAYKKGLTSDDIPLGSPLDSCDLNGQRLELLWQQEVAQKGVSGASFGLVVWRFIRTRVLVQSLLFSLSLLMGFISPTIFMRYLLEFAQDENSSVMEGILWAVCLTCCEFLRLVFFAWNWATSYRTGIRIRSACLALLYRKVLRVNGLADTSVGELINIFANDSQRIFDMVLFGPMIIGGPLVTICGVFYIYWLLGSWALFGMATFLLFYPTQYGISRLTSYLRGKTIIQSDNRVKIMTDILNSIKFIKMYAWEEYFCKCIKEVRSAERRLLQKASYCQSLSMSLAFTVPVISAVVTFLAHVSAGNSLSAAQAFPVVVYMRQQAGMILILVFESGMRIFDGFIALRRFQAFSVFAFFAKEFRSALNQAKECTSALFDGLVAVLRMKAFPTVTVFVNQLKDALSRIREGSKAVVESLVGCRRIKAFPMLAILNSLMRTSFDNLRIGTSNIYESLVAFPRFKRILCLEDIQPYIIRPIDKTEAVRVIDGTFSYHTLPAVALADGKKEREIVSSVEHERERLQPDASSDRRYINVLTDICFTAPKGHLVGVCGPVGAGKTSLLLACLGQMRKVGGQVMRDGHCAYVSQEAWILNATLKDNILFGEKFDSKRYYQAIYACSLVEDINMLPGGDQTEIGEKGINLSGGQKQRVALARALYSNRDVYFLDDPLSAVDAHVGAHIFEKYIKTCLKDKTVIFVTHQMQYLSSCDEVYMLKDGRVIEQGKHSELMEKDGEYAYMLRTCLQENQMEDDPLLMENELLAPDDVTSVGSFGKIEEELTDADKSGSARCTVAEPMERGHIKLLTYQSYVSCAGGVLVAALVTLSLLLNVGSSTFSTWWLAMWIRAGAGSDNASNGTNQTEMSNNLLDNPDFSMYRTVYAVTVGVILGTSLFRGFVFTKATLHASTKIHNKLFNKIIHCPMLFFETTPIGRIQNLFSRDMDEVDARLPGTVESLMQNMLIVLFAILLICLVFPWFIIPMAFLACVYYFVSKVFRVAVRDLKRLETVTRSPIYSWVGTTAQGLRTIHAFDKEDDFMRRFTYMFDENSTCLYLCCVAGRWLALRMDNLAVVITCITALLVIALHGQVPPAMAGLALAYSSHISGLFQYTIRLMSDTEVRFIAVERMNGFLKNVVLEGLAKPKSTPPLKWPIRGSIRFQGVSLCYSKGSPDVLRNISFAIDAGEKIGIVGRTGSGKSSLIVALFRLVELSGGNIEIDGIDISDLALEKLRSKLTVIPQDPVLFAGTIRSNIDPFGLYSDHEVWGALEKTMLKERVAGIEGQLETLVRQGGDNFSVGERQLFCLARALLKDTKILILDEATAAVDPETEVALQRTIQTEFLHCTVLTIAHRLSTVKSSDRVMVMDGGKVKEFEKPSILLANPASQFYQLCAATEKAVNRAIQSAKS